MKMAPVTTYRWYPGPNSLYDFVGLQVKVRRNGTGYARGTAPRHALHAVDDASGRTLDICITVPGAHLYTGNWLGDEGAKDASSYGPHVGFAFEPEYYPDAVHHADRPQPVCTPDRPYRERIVYRFGADSDAAVSDAAGPAGVA